MTPEAKSLFDAAMALPLEDRATLTRALEKACPPPMTGAELVAYWQAEGLIGTRPDIMDSQAHARAIREKAQRRRKTPRRTAE